jgi:hypothetical protein
MAQMSTGGTEKNMALELRNMILSSKPKGSSAAVIMDVNVDGKVISVMSSTDGDASIYLSSGGAMIGGGAHANIHAKSVAFATEVLKQKSEMQTAVESPYPAGGKVRLYLRTRDGLFFVEAPMSDLTAGTHKLSPVFLLGQDVLTAFKAINTPK